MSQVSELAELEAAIAEAELTDEQAELVKGVVGEGIAVAEAIQLVKAEAADEAARLAQPSPEEAGPSPEQLAELAKQVERNRKAVLRIFGDDGDGLETCEACDGVGLAPPQAEELQLHSHEWYRRCDTCDGIGQVATGSRIPGNATVTCPGCGGRGYQEALGADGQPISQSQGVPPVPGAIATSEGAAATLAPNGNGDQGLRFGRPAWMGDPSLNAAS